MMKISFFKTGGMRLCPLFFLTATLLFAPSRSKAFDIDSGSLSFEECIDSADYYTSAKHWKDAERMTVNALRLKPANKTNWLLWANLGEIRENLGDLTGALTAYDIGLSLQPSSVKMLSGRASIHIAEKNIDKALEDLNMILNLDPSLEWPRMIRGFLLLDKGDLINAEKDFSILKSDYPDNPKSYIGLASIKQRDGNTAEAIKMYEKSLELSADEDVYFNLIKLKADCGQLPQAAESLREALKKFPRNGNLFLLRAYLHKLNFQNEEAEIALKLAKEYNADTHLIEAIFPKNNNTKRSK